MYPLAERTKQIAPFHAVELLKTAQQLQNAGHDIISLGIGEPDFTAPSAVVQALQAASNQGLSQYTSPLGLPALRKAISQYYQQQFGAQLHPDRILVTTGASAALNLACLAVINPGDEILMPDPSYPANQNFVFAAGGVPKLIPCNAQQRYQLSARDVARHWGPATKGLLIASPSNPTGTSLPHDELKAIIEEVRRRQGFIIMDEIYLGLYYEQSPRSALTLDDDILIINSFSKYFQMTGWRLGWMIMPEAHRPAIERMAASLAICAPSLAQHAALACFEPSTLALYEERRLTLKARRDYLLPALEDLGFSIPVKPDGAFYIYADIRAFDKDSQRFAHRLLHEAHVVAVPGLDFGPAHAPHMLRFSYATPLPRLEQAIERMRAFLKTYSAAEAQLAQQA